MSATIPVGAQIVVADLRLLTRLAVCAKLSIGQTKFYELLKTGGFPQPHLIAGTRRWRSDEVDAWIERTAPVAQIAQVAA